LNPGNLKSELDRDVPTIGLIYRKLTTYPPIKGAYTELFAGLSEKVTLEHTGGWGKYWHGPISEIFHAHHI
jgi:retinol dehydrogenase-12